jgi:hypothetical protein
MARQDNEAKKRCLYVDIGQDGSLQQPSDIGEAAARDTIASRTGLVALVEAMTAHQTMLALGTIPAELRAEVEDVMRRVAEAGETDGTVAAITVMADALRAQRARYSGNAPGPVQDDQLGAAGE